MKNSKTSNPSQEEQPHNRPQPGEHKSNPPKEGDIRKVKQDDEVKEEDSKNKTEVATDDESNSTAKRDGDSMNKRAR